MYPGEAGLEAGGGCDDPVAWGRSIKSSVRPSKTKTISDDMAWKPTRTGEARFWDMGIFHFWESLFGELNWIAKYDTGGSGEGEENKHQEMQSWIYPDLQFFPCAFGISIERIGDHRKSIGDY